MRVVPTAIAAKLPRAAELIADRGLDQTKIEEVAEVTGIPKATLYYYFTGKEEILVFLLRDLLNGVADTVAIAIESDGVAAERLGRVIRAQLAAMAEQPAVWRALAADLGRAARLPELAEALATAYYQPVERLLAEGAADGSLRAVDNAGAASMAIFGAATWAGLQNLLNDPPLDVDRLAGLVTALVLHGVSS
jgi:TetR/AcrR family transcriptional regulator